MSEVKQMNIFEKLSAITNEIKGVTKDMEVGFGGAKYKAFSESQILSFVKKAEEKYRVYSYPLSREIVETGEIEVGKEAKKNLFLRIVTVYRFVNMDNPTEFVDITSYGDGVDSQDKSVGKAMTYADKYALMKAYKITTGDDPDQDPSEEQKSFKKKSSYKVSAEVMKQLKEANGTVEQVARFFNKDPLQVTDGDVLLVLEKRKQKLEKGNQ